jgi:hypothetical protein
MATAAQDDAVLSQIDPTSRWTHSYAIWLV